MKHILLFKWQYFETLRFKVNIEMKNSLIITKSYNQFDLKTKFNWFDVGIKTTYIWEFSINLGYTVRVFKSLIGCKKQKFTSHQNFIDVEFIRNDRSTGGRFYCSGWHHFLQFFILKRLAIVSKRWLNALATNRSGSFGV